LPQCHVRGDGNQLLAGELQPHPRTAIALIKRVRQGQPGLPLFEVGTIYPRVQRAVPVLDIGQILATKSAAHVEWLRQLGRWRRGEAKIVLLTAVMQRQTGVAQHQRGGAALFIVPDQGGAGDAHVALRQQPIDKAAFRLVLAQGDTRHMQATLRIAPHPERQVIHLQRCQPQLPAQQREP
jgi:hypothetical protein